MQTYASFNMFLQKHRLVQVLPRGRASFCTSDLGENEARGGSSNEVHCAVRRSGRSGPSRTVRVCVRLFCPVRFNNPSPQGSEGVSALEGSRWR